MNDQGNPFLYGRPVEQAEELIEREGVRAELQDSIRSGQPVMVYGPRRYGKTSLARVVEREAVDGWGIVAVHADLWSVSSVADIVGVLDRAYPRMSGVLRGRTVVDTETMYRTAGSGSATNRSSSQGKPLTRSELLYHFSYRDGTLSLEL
jgi:hypothetical protein